MIITVDIKKKMCCTVNPASPVTKTLKENKTIRIKLKL